MYIRTYHTIGYLRSYVPHTSHVQFLSRAFRNRFIELHFEEIPPSELVTILHSQSGVPESYAKKMVAVMQDLQVCTWLTIATGHCTLVHLFD